MAGDMPTRVVGKQAIEVKDQKWQVKLQTGLNSQTKDTKKHHHNDNEPHNHTTSDFCWYLAQQRSNNRPTYAKLHLVRINFRWGRCWDVSERYSPHGKL